MDDQEEKKPNFLNYFVATLTTLSAAWLAYFVIGYMLGLWDSLS